MFNFYAYISVLYPAINYVSANGKTPNNISQRCWVLLTIKNVSLFVWNIFFPKEEAFVGGEFKGFITFENQTRCLVLLCWVRVGKKEENSWERVKSLDGTKAKMQQESWKSLLMEHNELLWKQMCRSQFSHPMFASHAQTYLNATHFFFFLVRPISLHRESSLRLMAGPRHLSIKILHSQMTVQSYPLTEHTWQGVRVGCPWVLCQAGNINVIYFSITLPDSLFPSPCVSSSEDAVE